MEYKGNQKPPQRHRREMPLQVQKMKYLPVVETVSLKRTSGFQALFDLSPGDNQSSRWFLIA